MSHIIYHHHCFYIYYLCLFVFPPILNLFSASFTIQLHDRLLHHVSGSDWLMRIIGILSLPSEEVTQGPVSRGVTQSSLIPPFCCHTKWISITITLFVNQFACLFSFLQSLWLLCIFFYPPSQIDESIPLNTFAEATPHPVPLPIGGDFPENTVLVGPHSNRIYVYQHIYAI
mgnify:CR=1 FL=1